MSYIEEAMNLIEMARVGYMNNLEIYVMTDDPGKIPHMHIRDKATRGNEFHTCVRLDKPEYFHHKGKEGVLNSKQKRELKIFLESPNKMLEDKSNWEALLILWNMNNSDVEIDMQTNMPDYGLL